MLILLPDPKIFWHLSHILAYFLQISPLPNHGSHYELPEKTGHGPHFGYLCGGDQLLRTLGEKKNYPQEKWQCPMVFHRKKVHL